MENSLLLRLFSKKNQVKIRKKLPAGQNIHNRRRAQRCLRKKTKGERSVAYGKNNVTDCGSSPQWQSV